MTVGAGSMVESPALAATLTSDLAFGSSSVPPTDSVAFVVVVAFASELEASFRDDPRSSAICV